MVIECTHRLSVELSRDDGSPLEHFPIETDWTPAVEWTHFDGIRKGRLPAVNARGRSVVAPVWASDKGEPYLGGARVTVYSANGNTASWSCDIPVTYFKTLAQNAATELVEAGRLAKGETYQYAVSGFPAVAGDEPNSAPPFLVEESADPIPLLERSLVALKRQALQLRHEYADDTDMPVFVHEQVLSEASDMAQKAFPLEAGGILIGHLVRDSESGEIFAFISALIPALLAEGQVTRLTFTPETWTAVSTAIALRKRNELWCGWVHSHPAREWCKGCPPDRRAVCPLAKDYFSAEDSTVHRTVFSRAYSVALVANVTDDGITYSMFGWRQGSIKLRAFYVLRDGAF